MSGIEGPIKASDLIVKALENEGVEYIFGIPGEENLDMLESLRGSKIELVVTRHEQAAGFIAATLGRLTGKIGVCLSTLGPGATNFMTAAAYAQLGAMPMLMITGQKPIKTSKQARFQIIDVVEMMGPVTKYAHQIVHGANIPSAVREAIRLAEEERPGAVRQGLGGARGDRRGRAQPHSRSAWLQGAVGVLDLRGPVHPQERPGVDVRRYPGPLAGDGGFLLERFAPDARRDDPAQPSRRRDRRTLGRSRVGL